MESKVSNGIRSHVMSGYDDKNNKPAVAGEDECKMMLNSFLPENHQISLPLFF
jgi:hypothetical protein